MVIQKYQDRSIVFFKSITVQETTLFILFFIDMLGNEKVKTKKRFSYQFAIS